MGGNSKNFFGKVALITGSSSGIGAATAIEFAKLGAQVVVTGRNQQKIKKVIEECERVSKLGNYNHSKIALEIVADISNEDDCKRLVDTTIDTFGKIDVLFNNAGSGTLLTIFDEKYMQGFDNIMNLNLRSTVLITHLAVPHLIKTKGVIINDSSICGLKPMANAEIYCMTKCSMDMFTKCLAIELGPKGIRVNSINPGPIKTDIANALGLPKEIIEKMSVENAKLAPLRRVGEPEEIAKSVVFLASDDASFITGITLVQDGGILLTQFASLADDLK